ncbi:MAG: ATP-binding cassette domain-containing protein [Myxococcales bacterium]|nr:ATP-binding cassette domain-containing protein [Myxococcales bacterium]
MSEAQPNPSMSREPGPSAGNSPILSLRGVRKHFPAARSLLGRPKTWVRAVDGVDLDVMPGETLGLVGESGCGKSTLGRVAIRLYRPTEGRVLFEGEDISHASSAALRPLRRRMQIIFQDPYSSLNPRMTVRAMIAEAMWLHGFLPDAREEESKVGDLLERVGLRREHMRRYPHEFSGGQRQRIGIARALAVQPRFIVCDEPISALDVSIQAQIVNLLMDLQDELGLSYLFVAHDLQVVEYVSHRVAVMYLGRIVELAPAAGIYAEPLHPYTQALLSAVPTPDPLAKHDRIVLEGDVPSPLSPPTGCSFHPRCRSAEQGLCDRLRPPLIELRPGHQVACHLAR